MLCLLCKKGYVVYSMEERALDEDAGAFSCLSSSAPLTTGRVNVFNEIM